MEVRQATRADLLEIARVAHQSLWAACDGLLETSTIAAALDDGYSPGSLQRRLLAGGLLVAMEPAGRLVGFAEAWVEEERIAVTIHSAETPLRREWIDGLVGAVRDRYPGRPVSADVLLGNLVAELSWELAGFVPGETITRSLFGQQVVERRWWCSLPE